MTPNPFGKPDVDAPRNVRGSWALLDQKWRLEEVAYAELQSITAKRGTSAEIIAASKSLGFAEDETFRAAGEYFAEIRAYVRARETSQRTA